MPPWSHACSRCRCNDMLTAGCSNGSVVWRASPSTVPDVSRVIFSLADLRAQRAQTIWGDAFRRPFSYQPLCFPSKSREPPLETVPASTNTPDGEPFVVTVALLQMAACENASHCLSALETHLRTAAEAGADVALTPEMWSMGYSSQWTAGTVPPNNPQALREAFRWAEMAEPLGGPYLTRVAALAKEVGIAVAAGMQRVDAGDVGVMTAAHLWPPHNSVVLIDREGECVPTSINLHVPGSGSRYAFLSGSCTFMTRFTRATGRLKKR